jgi:hypothetical protein
MQQHRSIRAYKPDPVMDKLLNEILEAGIRASSSGNVQTYSIIVTRDRKLREQLYKPHMEQNMVLDAPVCDQIGRLLNLPAGVLPVAGFSLGYAGEDPAPRDRLPLEGLVHFERYEEYTDDRIREIYHEREKKGWERYMTFPDLRQMVEESGVENLAQLYTRVKYTRETHQEFSKSVLNYLTEQDFMHNA